MDERIRPILDMAGELDIREPRKELLIGNTKLHLRHP